MTPDTPKHAALYARVSTERQQAQNTIASQLSALREHAQAHHYLVPEAWEFVANGFSGRTLVIVCHQTELGRWCIKRGARRKGGVFPHRAKRYRAQAGNLNVLAGAPY